MAENIKTSFPEIDIKESEPLAKYTFTHTGGPADWVAFPKNVDEVQQLVTFAKDHDLPITVLGNASNLIVKDGGIAGLVLILTAMKSITVHDQTVTADAGAAYIDVTKVARDHSLSGI